MTRPSRAVIWDLDGTLVDSAPDLAAALNELLAEHRHSGHPVDRVKNMIGGGVKRLVMRGFEQAGAPLEDADVPARTDRFMEIYGARVTKESVPFPGIPEVLNTLSEHGAVHGVCTNKPLSLTRQILTDFGLSAHFKTVVGGDSTSAKKPDPEPLRVCLEQMGVGPENAVMVGDSAADLKVARALSMPVVLVSFGYSSEPVAELGPDAIVDHLKQLPETLERLGFLARTV